MSADIAARAVASARGWIGTPYRHQASCLGSGCDCLGLLRGVWRELFGSEPASVPPYSRDWAEAGGDETLLQAARTHLVAVPLGAAMPGDVIVFRLRDRGVAKHVGLQTRTGDAPCFVHAYERHGVIESPLSAPWTRRIAGRFRFPKESG